MFTVSITALNMSRYQISNVQRFPSQPPEWTEAAPVARRDYKWVTKRHLAGLRGLLTSAAMTQSTVPITSITPQLKVLESPSFFNMARMLTELIATAALLIHQACFIRAQINKEQLGNLLVPRALINTLNVLTTPITYFKLVQLPSQISFILLNKNLLSIL